MAGELVVYFEGIAWRSADSRWLREFLSFERTDATPAHNSMTGIRQRLPGTVFEAVSAKVLGLLHRGTLWVDAASWEANAAMKAMVRKAGGKT